MLQVLLKNIADSFGYTELIEKNEIFEMTNSSSIQFCIFRLTLLIPFVRSA